MEIYLTNTLTHKKEKFVPRNDKKVNFFVCGPTVYDFSHLGHAKTYIQFDLWVRYLRSLGFTVFYLQNITDLDDKIIKRAREQKIDWRKLALKFEKLYLEDMQKLNNTSVSKYARATDYLPQIVKQVQTLLRKGSAYEIKDGIYFEISQFPRYGTLSGRIQIKETDAVSRIDENEGKRGWNDFCLWKFSKAGEPAWESEIGTGRPGWHIEDTAITEHFFGPQYDVHGGAVDLIMPHHEAEIAQMESASGKAPLVKYWLHTGFLLVEGIKMSKSLGNFYTLAEVIRKGFDPLALRLLFLGSHYRDPLNFTWLSLAAAQSGLERLRALVDGLRQGKRTRLSPEKAGKTQEYQDKFRQALSDDLNAPQAVAVLWEMLKSNLSAADKYDLVVSFDEVFGLNLTKPSVAKPMPVEIRDLLKKRATLRQKGKFAEADKLRKKIIALGFSVEDESLSW